MNIVIVGLSAKLTAETCYLQLVDYKFELVTVVTTVILSFIYMIISYRVCTAYMKITTFRTASTFRTALTFRTAKHKPVIG